MVKLQVMTETVNRQSKQTKSSSSENLDELLNSMRTLLDSVDRVMNETVNRQSKQTKSSSSENLDELLNSMRTLLDSVDRVMNETVNRQSKQTKSSSSKNLDELLKSMRTLLDSVDHEEVEACSISLVPEQLRQSKVEAYIPQVVSIGPLHKGTRTNLLFMEEIKLRCMKHLFKRTKEDEETCLTICSGAMLDIDLIVRASYVDAVKFNDNDLAKIMVLDGCFLLELLICESPQSNEQLKCRLSTNPGADVLKREEVLSDLMLLENQIPLVVLDTLLKVLFHDFCEMNDSTRLIHERALSILGYTDQGSENSKLRAFHFVELVHSFIDNVKDVKEEVNISIESGEVANISIESGGVANISIESGEVSDLKLQRCATRLVAAGVTIKPKGSLEGESFDMNITFKGGELEIPQLHVTKTTEAKWRNFIAWELNRTSLEKHRGRKEEMKIRCQFICYAWFIQSLVCCVHDVKLLRERKVIVVDDVESDKGKKKKKKIMSDEDMMNLFYKMTEGVSDAEIEMYPRFVKQIQKLNSHTRTVDRATETSRVMWHILRCFVTLIWWYCRVSYRVLIRDYIPTGWKLIAVLAAAAGLALTATQTHYSIHPH